jgi:hypothetical protein
MISGFIQVSERKLPVILTLTGGINWKLPLVCDTFISYGTDIPESFNHEISCSCKAWSKSIRNHVG